MGECKNCGEPIRWMKNERERWVPVDDESVDDDEATQYDEKAGHVLHFETCRASAQKDLNEQEYQAELERGES